MSKNENGSLNEANVKRDVKGVDNLPQGNIGKKQLAMKYHPTLTYSGAIKAFNREIEANSELKAELERNYWDAKVRMYTIIQRDSIFKHLGNPYDDPSL